MQYPDIGRYRETLLNPHGLFRTLDGLKAGKDRYGNLFFIAGSNSVIFRAHISGRVYALKCYTKRDPGLKERYDAISNTLKSDTSGYFSIPEYLENEIFVFDNNDTGNYFPIVIWEYVEGRSLRAFLAEKCALKDKEAIRSVAEKFDRMVGWLLEQEFAHGDIKPDNIIVTTEGNLRLVDLDGMFLPEFKQMKSPELGTKAFQHPKRGKDFFNRHIDDFSLALISTALHALADFPDRFTETPDDENLIFDPAELADGRCGKLAALKNHWLESGRTALYNLAACLNTPSPQISGLSGKIGAVISPAENYGELGDRESMTIINKDGFFGYRDELTGEIIEPVYDEARPFGEGLATVRIMKKWYFIDRTGKVIVKLNGFSSVGVLKEGLATAEKDGKFGFIDVNGEIIVYLLYDHARNFNEGLAGVKTGGRYGFIDRGGKMVIDAAFDSVLDFREGLAVAGTGGKFGYVDTSGKFVIPAQYDFASGFRNGMATVEKDGVTSTLIRADYY